MIQNCLKSFDNQYSSISFDFKNAVIMMIGTLLIKVGFLNPKEDTYY